MTIFSSIRQWLKFGTVEACIFVVLYMQQILYGSEKAVGIQCKTATFANPRSLEEKIDTRSLERGARGQSDLPPSTFDTIHLIDLKFGTYNKLHLYFQLSETMCCLIGFHGNHCQINDVTAGRHLGFIKFSDFVQIYLRLTGKQHLAVEIHEIGRIHCEVVSI